MFGKEGYFYHQILKRTTTAFGTLFNNIYIKRKDREGRDSFVAVPLIYGPRDFTVDVNSNENQRGIVKKTLPAMSFELLDLSYNPMKKLSTNLKLPVCCGEEDGVARKYTFSAVPYIFNFSLYLKGKTMEDCSQVVEQILPWFTPTYYLKVKDMDSTCRTWVYGITLKSVTMADESSAEAGGRREIEWTFSFEVDGNFFGPVISQPIILNSAINTINEYKLESCMDFSQKDRDGDALMLQVKAFAMEERDPDNPFENIVTKNVSIKEPEMTVPRIIEKEPASETETALFYEQQQK